MTREEVIARQAAVIMGGRDWHKLTGAERALCILLEEAGYTIKKEVPNGFIGKPTGSNVKLRGRPLLACPSRMMGWALC